MRNVHHTLFHKNKKVKFFDKLKKRLYLFKYEYRKYKTKKLGRPVFNVNWPEGSFSAKDVYKALEGKLSHVSVKLKINKAVSEGSLKKG